MRQICAEDQRAMSELRRAQSSGGRHRRLADSAFACIYDDAHAVRYTRMPRVDCSRYASAVLVRVYYDRERHAMAKKKYASLTLVLSPQSAAAFDVVFGLYTAIAVFLLLLGLGSALAAGSPAILEAFQDAAVSGSRFAPVWTIVVATAPLSEAPGQVLLDYLLSGLNLGLGVFLVWRRPLDGVARLLGLAMVGTAAAFNLQAHTAFAAVDSVAPELHAIVPIHWVLHAVSGAAYLHALLVFPNGKVVPARLVWLVRLAYVFMVEEILLTFVTGSVGLLAVPFQLLFGFHGFTPDVLPKLIDSDATFVVVFFGVLLPVAGATSQAYRYLAVSEPNERERARLVVWALTLAFGVGASFLLVAIGSTLARGAGFAEHLLGEADFVGRAAMLLAAEGYVSTLAPPIVVVGTGTQVPS